MIREDADRSLIRETFGSARPEFDPRISRSGAQKRQSGSGGDDFTGVHVSILHSRSGSGGRMGEDSKDIGVTAVFQMFKDVEWRREWDTNN